MLPEAAAALVGADSVQLEREEVVTGQARSGYRGVMTSSSPRSASDQTPGLHLATIAHEARLWDVYLDFENDPRRPATFRARMRFEPPPGDERSSPTETTVIIIEDSYEEAVAKARRLDDLQLQGLLRSTLPDGAET